MVDEDLTHSTKSSEASDSADESNLKKLILIFIGLKSRFFSIIVGDKRGEI